ncbi:urease accessory protein UreF [Salinibacterium sp. dk2585]|uniref:urease accessory protein UreF n=1 Tax=unclassified Salinibacterium TaxID=2632331 RepID=UPI0011C24B29|nr:MULTISPECIES: urease accessory UreF family protein [unclassified Salinibacterium]QEE62060.1 urease accessory protein UreF [Salinibacterium sp. dk2585]TXK53412.1 urease accessory protein UreF [Salinibacterium sp. dk5596]
MTAAPPVDAMTVAMLLADSRLPSGAHVSSNGLEAALNAGVHPAHIPDYLSSRMATVVRVEAGTAIAARAAVVAGVDVPDTLERVEAEWAARTPSAALRTIAAALGAGLGRLACLLWPESPVIAYASGARMSRATLLGTIAAEAGISPGQLARLVAYDDAQTVAAATLKLEPLDPATPARWVLDACAEFEASVPLLAQITQPEAIPAAGAPQIEEWAEAHSQLTRRLFRA